MKVQIFNYTIIKELPIRCLNLRQFKTHRRLITFFTKGTKCVNCERIGTRLILGQDGCGNLHWDVYTSTLYPLTVDHIIPKSKGGLCHVDNYQPMCHYCNRLKGNGDKHHGIAIGTYSKWPNQEKKDRYYKKKQKRKQKRKQNKQHEKNIQ